MPTFSTLSFSFSSSADFIRTPLTPQRGEEKQVCTDDRTSLVVRGALMIDSFRSWRIRCQTNTSKINFATRAHVTKCTEM